MNRLERSLLRLMLAVFITVALGAATFGPAAMLKVLIGAGTPNQGEVVPRQIPYRGYIELNGVPFDSSGVSMRFRLRGLDGGLLHEETQNNVVVQQGQFSVEIGDSSPIAPGVLRENFIELEIGVGSPPQPLQGRQRILSVPFAHSAGTGVPAGTVVAYAGEAIPAGWLLCDGSVVSAVQYPSLCAALAGAWGSSSVGSCKLPDLRGQFLRGAHAPMVDPDGDRAVGSQQADDLESHAHPITQTPHSHGLNGLAGNPPGALGHPRAPGGQQFYFNNATYDANANITVDAWGGPETRPINAGVNFIVKT